MSYLENVAAADIVALVALITLELFHALRFAAQNRVLQTKVYKDEATGLPTKTNARNC